MMRAPARLSLAVLIVATLLGGRAMPTAAAPVDAQDVRARLAALSPPPRLLLTRGEEARLRDAIAADPQLRAVWELVRRAADGMLEEPPVTRTLVGRRLLGQSRACLRRMTHLGLAYRLTGEQKYADRGRAEMLAAAAFTDWNPSHFLDVAEMTAALAIGVDWLHEALDEPTRATIRRAIVEKGLTPSLTNDSWARGDNNWNQVCNAGMTLGALVVAGEARDLAVTMVARAIDGVPFAMKGYAPDGAYPEGASYWEYGTSFNVLLIAALQKALGSDFGLLAQPGFDRTAEYRLHVQGPTGLWFNYVDSSLGAGWHVSPAMHFLAAWRNEPGLLHGERHMLRRLVDTPGEVPARNTDRLLPLLLVWHAPGAPEATPASLSYVGRGMTPVALFRSGWDRQATYAGIKGGQASSNHGHMDVGTFVVDMMGERFADDLGMQDYNSLESIGLQIWDRKPDSDRWKVFRLHARSHNVLTVTGTDHVIDGRGDLVSSTPTSARVDLSGVFAGQLANASRELRLREDRGVEVRDDVVATDVGSVVRWQIVTGANVALDGARATLTVGARQAALRIAGLDGVRLQSRPADPPPAAYDAPNPGKTIVWFEVRLKPGERRTWTAELVPLESR